MSDELPDIHAQVQQHRCGETVTMATTMICHRRQSLAALLAIGRNSRFDVSATFLESGLRIEHLPTR